MNGTLRKLEDWLNMNKRFINCTKSKVMHLGMGGGGLSPIYQNGVNLEFVDSFKYLGVVVDGKLNFKSHYSELLKNVNRKVQYFGKASNNLNMNTRILRCIEL